MLVSSKLRFPGRPDRVERTTPKQSTSPALSTLSGQKTRSLKFKIAESGRLDRVESLGDRQVVVPTESQLRHKIVNLWFTLSDYDNKLTILWGS